MCGICRKDFAYKHVLKRHMKVHRVGGTNDEVKVHVVEVEVDQIEEVEDVGMFSIMSAASTLARQPSYANCVSHSLWFSAARMGSANYQGISR